MLNLKSTLTTKRTRASVLSASRRSSGDAEAGMVMLVGVQSNQFPRALDIAAPLRQRGIIVAIGGFHVSGTIAMLPSVTQMSAGQKRWVYPCSQARPKVASGRCYATPPPEDSIRSTIS